MRVICCTRMRVVPRKVEPFVPSQWDERLFVFAGVPPPCPRGTSCYFSLAGKVTRRALKGSPLENPQFCFYLPFAVAGLILPMVHTLRLPPVSVYPRVLTGAKQRGECLWFCRAAIRRVPVAGSIPLRGRQAELFKYQSTRSEPRRAHSFTGHRSSSLAGVSEKPPFILGFLGAGAPKQLFGYFLSAQKVPAGCGAA